MKPKPTESGWYVLAEEGYGLPHEPEYYFRSGCEVVRYRNRVVFRLEEGDGEVLYAKWLYPQNEGFVKRFENRIKRFFRGPRVEHIYEMHQVLRVSGFGCAEPLLAAWREDDMSELFVSREICAPPIHTLIREDQEARNLVILKIVAEDMRRLHKNGFIHGDAIPGNICVDMESSKVFYLDNDRTHCSWSRHQALRNLVQFCSHLPFYCKLPNVHKFFIDAYGVSSGERKWLLSAIGKRIAEITNERRRDYGE